MITFLPSGLRWLEMAYVGGMSGSDDTDGT
jgi:hypothetical protein